MNRLSLILVLIILIPIIQSCASIKPELPKRQDHLIGKIIETTSSKNINFDTLINKISKYDVIYLSEKHDNPDQHIAQQKIIKALIKKGRKNGRVPSIGFEFFSMDNTPLLMNFIESGSKKHSTKVEALIEKDLRMKLGWHTQSDQAWGFYYDLLKTARSNNIDVAGIDLSSSIKKRITRKGINGITPFEKEQIFSTGFKDTYYQDYMHAIFKAVHCGMGGKNMQSRLYDTWLARNDKMAYSISRMHAHARGPVIVIVGQGHTEYNLGIINRLPAIDKSITQINVGLTEITKKPSHLADYLVPLELEGYDKVPPADFLWFFQRVSYANPCERFKKILEKMKSK